jgi:hypothetical protein
MKIKTEACNGDKPYFRINIPGVGREYVMGEYWTRAVAKQALDLLERVYHLKRRNIRFV